jgi:amino acid adenylation domain-containing protein
VTAREFLSYLEEQDIQVWADGDRLRYSAPEGGLTVELRAELVRRKAEILAFLRSTATMMLPIEPISRAGDLPASFAQQRLWFMDQLEPDLSAYVIPARYHLHGPLDVRALERSLNEALRRHEALRTSFSAMDGEPVQVIAPTLTLNLPIVDLRRLPENQREAEARRLASEERLKPFDLSQGPLLRTSLLRLDDEEHVLLLNVHHIISDGLSMGILARELSVLYEAYCSGRPSPLPDLPIQYADYAAWQREWLQGEMLEEQLAYWRKQLEGAPPLLELPTDRPRPAVQTHQGAEQTMALPPELTQQLRALSQREGVTLFMTLLATFKILLCRLSGQDDVVVGTPVAGRNHAEIEEVIGLFVNNLVLRTDLSGNPTFLELLRRVREAALEAYDHQDLPFEKLVMELQPERDLSQTPLFQIFVNMHSVEALTLHLSGLTVEPFQRNGFMSHFDLTAYILEEGKEIRLSFVYRVDLFDQARMAEMMAQFRHLLAQVAAAPDRPIRAYSLVTPESRPLLPDPGMALPEPAQEPVLSQILSWAQRTPQQPAVSQGEQTWSYAELTQKADTLARSLWAHGLQPGQVVAVRGARTFGLIVAAMAVLQSGGVLLTVDPHLPRQRQHLMLREAGARAVLWVDDEPPSDPWWQTDLSLDSLTVEPATGCARLDDLEGDLKGISLPTPRPDDPAYIFFTSGTTGTPKGILGRHKGLSHFVAWQREAFAIGAGDRVAQLTTLSFDVVLRDIFTPLVSGATLCLPEERDELEPRTLVEWLRGQQITIVHTVPSLAHFWLSSVPAAMPLPHMRWLFFAGEPLTDSLVGRWRTTFPGTYEIVNLYGPTETTLCKCFYVVPADPEPGVQSVGQPMPQTQALVLTEERQLCGVGEPGEIVLRTPFRTLGYINAPDEDQQRFARNPFRDLEDDLLYYSGDWGRYRPDGLLDFLGRRDDQVKIRGVRVEPGEVAATLARHPGVAACAVVPREDGGQETYLAAYVVAAEGDGATSSELRSYLGRQLPVAAVPSAFVFLERLPLLPNGKVDRRALPAPDEPTTAPTQAFVAPRTPVEEVLISIWAEVLGIERIGVHDNFFDLGGHSLLATQVVAHMRRALRVEVPLRSVFEAPTIAELAQATVAQETKPGQTERVAKLLREIKGMPTEEMKRMLQEERDKRGLGR